ncbi:inorganic phosphate transporter [Deinococcus misasensis]|uniref:inorganic phosphate transporter n=1 Tax=Deinococcus misasensis TaxID=392413 RepID=UPI00068DD8CB|nr:inorganic phosphate transporter [Deinococcus misasensis]
MLERTQDTPQAVPNDPKKSSWTAHPLTGLGIAVLSTLLIGGIFGLLSMPTAIVLGLILVAWLAAENGGNDVAKGIAPLVAGGLTSDRGALLYGTLTTIAGSVVSIYLSSKVLKVFTSGLVAPESTVTVSMTLAIALAASLWVAFATRFSLPVSTTHAIVGSIVAVGMIGFGTQGILWDGVAKKVVSPLLLGPLLGLTFGLVLTVLLSAVKVPERFAKGSTWLTTGGICFVRSMNDTPKIVAITFFLLTAGHFDVEKHLLALFLLITVAMAVGSYVKGLSVTHLLAHKVTKLSPIGGLTSSLSTVGLVYAASVYGLPVSTTHVATSAILGSGMQKGVRTVNWGVVRDMALSWVITLPVSGLIAALAYLLIRLF